MGTRYHFGRAIAFRFVPRVGGGRYAPCDEDSIGKQVIRARIRVLLMRKKDHLAASILGGT